MAQPTVLMENALAVSIRGARMTTHCNGHYTSITLSAQTLLEKPTGSEWTKGTLVIAVEGPPSMEIGQQLGMGQ